MDTLITVAAGYPCHKYIARNLKTSEDITLFIREFLGTVITNKYVDNDFSLALTLLNTALMDVSEEVRPLLPEIPSYSNNDEAAKVCADLVGSEKLKKCTAYYKIYDRKCSCCSLCQISKGYSNSDEQTELAVMKYMLSSKDALDSTLSYIEGDFFRSTFDVAMEIHSQKGYAVPVLRELALAAINPTIRINLFDTSNFGGMNLNMTPYDYLFEELLCALDRKYRVSSDISNNPSWSKVLKSVIWERISSATDLTDGDAVDLFNAFLAGQDFSLSANTAAGTQVSCFDSISIEENPSSVDETSVLPIESSTLADYPLEDTSVSQSENTSLEEVGNVPEGSDSSALVEEPSVADLKDSLLSEEGSSVDEDKHEVGIYHDSDLILHLSVSDETIKTYFEILERDDKLDESVFNGFLTDKELPIEVVRNSLGDYAFLIYSRHSKKYYISLLSSLSVQLISLISRQMVTKVCYTPYLLFGLCKLYNLQIRNVFSLQTMHRRANAGSQTMSYSALIDLYENRPGYATLDNDLRRSCIFTYGMPSYKGIHHVLTNMLDEYPTPLLIDIDKNVDETVGASFFYKRNFNDNGFLVKLLPNGKFLYSGSFEEAPLQDGKYVNYVIDNSLEAYNFFRYLLYALARDGHSRKLNFQLVVWKNNYLGFYTDEYSYEFFTTIINMYMYEYGSVYPGKKIQVRQLIKDAKSLSPDYILNK